MTATTPTGRRAPRAFGLKPATGTKKGAGDRQAGQHRQHRRPPPALHGHLGSGKEPLTSHALPFEIDSFLTQGVLTNDDAFLGGAEGGTPPNKGANSAIGCRCTAPSIISAEATWLRGQNPATGEAGEHRNALARLQLASDLLIAFPWALLLSVKRPSAFGLSGLWSTHYSEVCRLELRSACCCVFPLNRE